MHATAEFALTRGDFARLQRVMLRRLRAGASLGIVNVASKAVGWMLIASAIFLYVRLVEAHPADASVLYTMAALVVGAIALARLKQLAMARDLNRRLLADAGSFLRPHSLEVTQHGLNASWRTGRSEMAWSEFLARTSDDANHYLFVDGCSALVVPRHAVAPFQADFERLIEAIPE